MSDERGAPDATLAVWISDDTRDETLAFIERMGGGEEWSYCLRMGGVEAEHVELLTPNGESVLAARLVEQSLYVDAMREALRRLGDLADAVQRGGEDARGAWLISQREGLVAKMKTDAFLLDLRLAAQAARDLHAPKES